MSYIIDLSMEIFKLFLEMAPYLLLGLFFVGLLHILFPKSIITKHMGKNNASSVVKASILGVPLPLCSCGVIPTAVFMYKNGASKSAVISFIISTPQTGVDSIIATYGMLGWVFAIFRPVAAFIMGITGGILARFIDKNEELHLDDPSVIVCNTGSCSHSSKKDEAHQSASKTHDHSTDIDTFALHGPDCLCSECTSKRNNGKKTTFTEKIKAFYQYAFVEFLDDISMHFITGIIIAGLISFFIPDNFFSGSFLTNGIGGMLLVILIGIPMYICATSSIPIALSLIMKGFSPGIAFVFLAVGPGTNAATIVILMKILGKKMTVFYLSIIIILSVIAGYILDFVYKSLEINPHSIMNHAHGHGIINGYTKTIMAAVFLVLIAMSVYRKKIKKGAHMHDHSQDTPKKVRTTRLNVYGMTCNHCAATAKSSVMKVRGVTNVTVNLNEKYVDIEGDFDIEEVKKAILDVGYTL